MAEKVSTPGVNLSFVNNNNTVKTDGIDKKAIVTPEFNNTIQNSLDGYNFQNIDRYKRFINEIYPNVNLERQAAQNQTGWGKVGNMFSQGVLGEILAQGVIGGIGSIMELPDAIADEIAGRDADFSNFMMKFADNITEEVGEMSPIFRYNPDKAFDFKDVGWWTSNGVSVFSTLGMLIPAMGVTKGASMISKALKTLSASSKLKGVSKGINAVSDIMNTEKYWQGLTHSAIAMRNAENMRESSQSFNTIRDEALNLFRDKEEYNKVLNSEIGQEFLAEGKEADEVALASFIASKAAWKNYGMNSVNVIFDAMQLAPIFKGFKINTRTSKLLTSSATKEAQKNAISGLQDVIAKPKFNAYPFIKGGGVLVGEQISEGAEELVNAISQSDSNWYGKHLLGQEKDKQTSARFGEYLRDPSSWEQAFWGFAGGVVFSGATRGIASIKEAMNDFKDPHSDQSKIEEIQNRYVKIATYSTRLADIQKGINPNTEKPFVGDSATIERAKEDAVNRIKTELAYDLGFNAAKTGNVEMLLDMIEHPNFKQKFTTEYGLTDEANYDATVAKLKQDILDAERTYKQTYDKIFTATASKPHLRNLIIGAAVNKKADIKQSTLLRDRSRTRAANLKSNNPAYDSLKEKNKDKDFDLTYENMVNAEVIAYLEAEVNTWEDETSKRVGKEKITQYKNEFKLNDKELGDKKADGDFSVISDIISADAETKLYEMFIGIDNTVYEEIINTNKSIPTIETELKAATEKIYTAQFDTFRAKINDLTKIDPKVDTTATIDGKIAIIDTTIEDLNKDKVDPYVAKDQPTSKLDKKKLDEYIDVLNKRRNWLDQQKALMQADEASAAGVVKKNEDLVFKTTRVLKKIGVTGVAPKFTGVRNKKINDVISAQVADLAINPEKANILGRLVNIINDEALLDNYSAEQLTEFKDALNALFTNLTGNKIIEDAINEILVLSGYITDSTIVNATTTNATNVHTNNADEFKEAADSEKNVKPVVDFGNQNPIKGSIVDRANRWITNIINDGDTPLFDENPDHGTFFKFESIVAKYGNLVGARRLKEDFEYLKQAYTIVRNSKVNPETGQKRIYNTDKSLNSVNVDAIITAYGISDEFKEQQFSSIDNLTPTGGETVMNVFLPRVDTTLNKNGDQVVDDADIARLRLLLDTLGEESSVIVQVDSKYNGEQSFSLNKNKSESIPIAIYAKDDNTSIPLGYIETLAGIHEGVKYNFDGKDWTDVIINDTKTTNTRIEYLSRLMPLIRNYFNLLKTSNDKNEISKAYVELIEADIHEVLYDLIGRNIDIRTEKGQRAITHIAKVMFFGMNTVGTTPIESKRNEIIANVLRWKDKLYRDHIGAIKVRETLGIDIDKFIETKIKYITTGSLVKSKNEDGTIKYRNLSIIGDPKGVQFYKIQTKSDSTVVENTRNGSDTIVKKGFGKFKGSFFVGIPTRNGKTIPSPVMNNSLNGNLLSDENSKKLTEKVGNLLIEIGKERNLGAIATKAEDTAAAELHHDRVNKLTEQVKDILNIQDEDRGHFNQVVISKFDIRFSVSGVWYVYDYYGNKKDTYYTEVITNDGKTRITKPISEQDFKDQLGNVPRNINYYKLGGKPYTDIFGNKHNNYEEYLIASNSVVTEIGQLIDKKGNKISNFTIAQSEGVGGTPLMLNIDTTAFKTGVDTTTTFAKFGTKFDLDKKYNFIFSVIDTFLKSGDIKFDGTGTVQYKDPATGNMALVYYDPNTKKIVVTKDWFDKHKKNKENATLLLVHDILHGLIGTRTTAEQKALNDMLTAFKADLLATPEYKILSEKADRTEEENIILGILNITDAEEILTYGLTNIHFAKFLDSIKSTDGKVTVSFWSKLKEIIREIAKTFGVGTKLDELSSIFEQFITGEELQIKTDSNIDTSDFDLYINDEEEFKPVVAFENTSQLGIDEIFKQVPELSQIGTKEDYINYISTIFPGSTIKDIVYHGTDQLFDKFDLNFFGRTDYGDSGYGIYFSKQLSVANTYGKNIIPALINVKNPYYTRNKQEYYFTEKHFNRQSKENPYVSKLEEIKKERNIWLDKARKQDTGYVFFDDINEQANDIGIKPTVDELISFVNRVFDQREKATQDAIDDYNNLSNYDSVVKEDYEIVVTPEQIHILSSNENIEGFRKYVENPIKPASYSSTINKEITNSSFELEEETNILNVVSNIFITNVAPNFKGVKGKDVDVSTVRSQLVAAVARQAKARAIEGTLTTEQRNLLIRVIKELDGNDDFYDYFRIHLSNQYGYNINEEDDFTEDIELLEKSWEQSDVVTKNPLATINDRIKELINTTYELDPNNSEIKNGKIVYKTDTNTPTGFANTLNYNQRGNKIIDLMRGCLSKEDMLTKIFNYATNVNTIFAKSLFTIHNALSNDSELLNAWYTAFDKAIQDSYRDLHKKSYTEERVDTEINIIRGNRNTAEYKIANDWTNTIISRGESGYYTAEWLENYNKKYTEVATLSSNFDNLTPAIIDNILELYKMIGISITADALIYEYSNNRASFVQTMIFPLRSLAGVPGTTYKFGIPYIVALQTNPDARFNEFGNLLKFATKIKYFREDHFGFSNINVMGTMTFDAMNPSFLSNFFKKLSAEDHVVFDEFIAYTNILSNQHSLLLWGDEIKGEEVTKKGLGIFNYRIENNVKVAVSVNRDNVDNIKLAGYEGTKNLDEDIASEYSKLTENDWTLRNLIYYFGGGKDIVENKQVVGRTAVFPMLNPSDRKNTRFIEAPILNLSVAHYNLLVSGKATLEQLREIPIFKAIYQNAVDELMAMDVAKNTLFELKDGRAIDDGNYGFVLKPEYTTDDKSGQIFYHYKMSNGEKKYLTFKKNDDGTYALDNSKSGNIFDVNNLTITVGNAQKTFNNLYIGQTNFIRHLMLSKSLREALYTPLNPEDENSTFKNRLEQFVRQFVVEQINSAVVELKKHQKSIETSYIKKENINRDDKIYLLKGKSFDHAIVEYTLNSYLFNTEQVRLFYGSIADYKSNIDLNKRGGQVIANGIPSVHKGTFRGATISDVKLKSLVYKHKINTLIEAYNFGKQNIRVSRLEKIYTEDELRTNTIIVNGKEQELFKVNEDGSSPERTIYNKVSPYLLNDSANAVSFVTFPEFVKRISGFGMTAQYKVIIDKISTGQPLNREDTIRFASMQKNFYYSLDYNEDFGKMVPNQVKNAEIILTPALVKDLQLETLLNVMNKQGLVQINLESAEKIGSFHIATIADDNGNLLEESVVEAELIKATSNYNYEGLRMQLEAPDAIFEESITMSRQFTKKLIENIPNTGVEYTINGKKLNGKELKAHYFELLNTNIYQDAAKTIMQFNVRIDTDGNIVGDIDYATMIDILEKEGIDRGLSKNMLYSVALVANTQKARLPIWFNTYSTKFENILTSLFTNGVTNQKFPGLHAYQMSSLFMNRKKGVKQSELTDTTGINWHESMFTRLTPDGKEVKRNDIKLRSSILLDSKEGLIQEAEVLLPRWAKEFYTKDGYVDINSLPDEVRTMIGYRIPMEAKYSAYVFKVVGFLPDDNGPSIVLPDDFVTQTGSDFDMDSVYAFLYNIHKTYEKTETKEGDKTKTKTTTKIERIRYYEEGNIDEKVEAIMNDQSELVYILSLRHHDNEDLTKIIVGLNEDKNEFYDQVDRKSDAYRQFEKEFKRVDEINVRLIKAKGKEKRALHLEKSELLTRIFSQSVVEDYKTKVNYTATVKEVKEIISNLENIEQNTRKARENELLDTYYSIMTNIQHYPETIATSNFNDISNAKRIVDTALNNSEKKVNNLTIAGQQHYRNKSTQGRDLKGISLALDRFNSIAQVARIELTDKLKDDKNSPSKIVTLPIVEYVVDPASKEGLINNYGSDVTFETRVVNGITKEYAIVTHRFIGNNPNNTFKNVKGEYINSYSTQTTANILDNVAFPLPNNVNSYTINIWKMIASIGSTFEVSTSLMNQPIIRDLANTFFNVLNTVDRGSEIEATKRKFQTLLYRVQLAQGAEHKSGWDKQIAKGKDIFVASGKRGETQYKDLGYQNGVGIPLNEEVLIANINSITVSKSGRVPEIERELSSETPNKDRLKQIENDIRYQLQILETFKHLKSYSDAINDGTTILNTDKIGAGPTFDVTNKLIYEIERSHEQSILKIDGTSAMINIFPKHFGVNKLSAYPSLEQFLVFSNKLSVKAFAEYFIGQSSLYKEIKTELNAYVTDKKYDTKLAVDVTNYLNNSLLKDLYWLNTLTVEEKRTLLGIETELDLTLDLNDPESLSVFESLSVANQVELLRKYKDYGDANILNNLKISTQKVEIERNGYHKIDYVNNDIADKMTQSFNDLWYSNNVFERLVARNLVRYEYIANGFTFGFSSFAKIIPNNIFFYETEPFIDGLYTEKGIGLSNHLYIKQYLVGKLNFTEDNKTSEINEASEIIFNSNYKERFIKANWANDRIVPNGSSLKYWDDAAMNGDGELGAYVRYLNPSRDNGIIAIGAKKFQSMPTSRLSNKVKEKQIIKLGTTTNGKSVYQLFQRYDNFVSVDEFGNITGTYYFYPIAKLSPFENESESVFPENNRFWDNSEIQSADDYISMIAAMNDKKRIADNTYKETLPLEGRINDIKSDTKTAVTLPMEHAKKFFDVAIGTYVKIGNLDEYVKVTKVPKHIDLSASLAVRKEWAEKNAVPIEDTHVKVNGVEYQDRKDLFQMEFIYAGNLAKIIKDSDSTISDEGEFDDDPTPNIPGGKITFKEHSSEEYDGRTRENASADATIAIASDFTTGGETLTTNSVIEQGKQYIPIALHDIIEVNGKLEFANVRVDLIVEKLNEVAAHSINMAGNSMASLSKKYTQQQIDEATYNLLEKVVNHDMLENEITLIRSGGQSGIDEAGAKAGIRLGIPTLVLAPKGWRFRLVKGKDIFNEKQFKERFNQTVEENTDGYPDSELNLFNRKSFALVVNYGVFEKAKEAYRAGNGIWTMRPNKDVPLLADEHFGNPFSPAKPNLAPETIVLPNATDQNGAAVTAYKEWLDGTNYTDVQQKRREYILRRINSGELKGENLIYYKPGNYYSHADLLAKLINDKEIKKPFKPVAYTSSTNQSINNAINSAVPFIEKTTANFANRVQIYKNLGSLKDSLNALTDADLKKLVAENNLGKIAEALSIILKQYDLDLFAPKEENKKGGLVARLNEYENIDMATILNDKLVRKEFIATISRASFFLKGVMSFDTLSSTDSTDLADGEKVVNDLIKQLQALHPTIHNIKTKVENLWSTFEEANLYQYTSNPEIVSGIRRILDAGDDESYFQMKLDALADTNNSFAALMVKQYAINMINADTDANEEITEFEALLRKAFPGRNITTLTEADFAKYLETKDGRKTGKLIQKYDWERFYADKKAHFDYLTRTYGKGSQSFYNGSKAWYNNNELRNVTEDEFDAIDRKKQEELSASEYAEWRKRNVKVVNGEKRFLLGDSALAVPSDKYINPKWTAVKDDALFQKFVGIIHKYTDYFGRATVLNRGFIPTLTNKEKESLTVAEKVKQWIAVNKYKAESESFVGENDEMVYLLTVPMANYFSLEEEIKISPRKKDELESDYQARVVSEVRAAGKGTFKTLSEIYAKNKQIREANDAYHAGKIDYNLADVFTKFIKEATTYKAKSDMKYEYDMGLNQIRALQFNKRDSKSKLLKNRAASKALGKPVTGTESGEGTNLEQHFSEWLEAIFYGNFDINEGDWTTISKMLLKYTSAKNMWFNMTAGINNVMIGKIQTKLEEFSGWYFKTKNLNKADKMYISAIPDMISNLGSTKSGTLTNAIIKKLDITQNTNERDYTTGMLKKQLLSWSSMYFLNDMGEHYLQNVSTLAMMDHHRIINGKIMSLAEFNFENYKTALNGILNDSEREKLDAYLKARYDVEEFKESKKDYLRDYILDLPVDKRDAFVKAKAELDKNTSTSFESYPKLIDAFYLDENGYAQLKEEAEIEGKKYNTRLNENEYAKFVNKAKHVVQKQQGIYNKEDAGTMQRTALGKMVIQFKKYMRPGWNKRFGSKFGKSYWTESRDEYDKGAYVSLYQFLAKPFKKKVYDTEEAKQYNSMMGRILGDMYDFITNVGVYWNTLDDFEKGNIRRASLEMAYLASVLLIGGMLKKLKPEDDDDENFAYDLTAYEVDRLLSSLMMFTPFGVINEGQKILKSPAAVQGTLIDTYKVISNMVAYPFRDEEERVYKTGIYAKEGKVDVSIKKLIPIVNKVQQLQRINKFNKYYILFRG